MTVRYVQPYPIDPLPYYYTLTCRKNGDAVVYSLYNKNHNQCKRNQMGTYKMSVEDFIRAYTRQVQKEYENNGKEYQVNGETMAYLQCQEYYYNNNLVSTMPFDILFSYANCCLRPNYFLTVSFFISSVLHESRMQKHWKGVPGSRLH